MDESLKQMDLKNTTPTEKSNGHSLNVCTEWILIAQFDNKILLTSFMSIEWTVRTVGVQQILMWMYIFYQICTKNGNISRRRCVVSHESLTGTRGIMGNIIEHALAHKLYIRYWWRQFTATTWGEARNWNVAIQFTTR